MKYAPYLLAISLTGSVIAAACSATNTAPPGGTAGSGVGAGATGAGAATGSGGGTTSSSSSSSGTGGQATSSGTGGTTTTGTGGTSSSSSSSSSGSSGWPVDFGGGWQVPDAGMQAPLIGDGGTTTEIGPGADSSSPGKFGGSSGSAKPTIVYPPDGVVLPPNTNALEFHFIPAAGQTLFEITFHAPTTNLSVFVGCTPLNGGCVYTPDATFWSSLVAYARGTQPVTYTIKGVNGSSPGQVGTSATQSIAFGDQDMTGGIYYWNTAGVVQRYDFGLPSAPAQLYLTAANVGGIFCVGCHAMSRQGNRIAAGADIPAPAPYKVLDVLSKQPLTAGGQELAGSSNFFSFSPDEKHLLLSDGVSIYWRDLTTGQFVPPTSPPSPAIAAATMPDWSPDGLHVVMAKPQQTPFFTEPGVSSASLMTAHFNGTGFDAPATLVPFGGQNNYYPSYSPTGQWVVFNRSPSNYNSFSNAGPDPEAGTLPDGELWAVSANGGSAIRLSAASNPGALSWPKWAPVLHSYYDGKIMWLTFSSARAYGLRLSQGQRTQLWMVGFDPAKAAAGQDPSYPAFWLPFQDINGGNHIAQWVTKVPRKACTQQSDCPAGEICKTGHCIPG